MAPTTIASVVLACGLVLGAAETARGAEGDAVRGEVLFKQRCAVCHPTGDGIAQAPGLGGVVGRKAAVVPGFAYSRALASSGLTWDRATLDHYLASPATFVPGTTMGGVLPDPDERRDVIAYLVTLAHPAAAPIPSPPSSSPSSSPSPVATPGLRSGKAAFGDYRDDGPGVRRRFTVADLPAPYATTSSRNGPRVVPEPEGVAPHVPPGFSIARWASDLKDPRLVRVAPNGDVFVAESAANQLRVLRAKDGATAPDRRAVFARDLDRPFGIAFYPPGRDPRWIYVANTNSVVRFPYRNGDLTARGPREVVIARLTDSSGGHWTRDVVFSKDGKRMFVSVGSASNVAEGLPARAPADVKTWEAAHGLGAAWGDEERRADVLVFDPDGKSVREFATGIRNCVGMAIHPATGDLWCSTNERDGLGDDLVCDYVTRVRDGAFYGWPWFYLGDHEDPRHKSARPDLAGRVTLPDVLLQPHSAPLEMTFYDGAMFPAAYRGDAFVALHGSWNRSHRTGYKIVRVRVDGGVPTGEYEDFVTGFVVDDDRVWARPVGVAVAHDGALLFGDDGNGTLWRVSYAPALR